MDELAALRLQIVWGVDEILLPEPQNRRLAKAPMTELVTEPAAPKPATIPFKSAAAMPAGPAEAARIIAEACGTLDELRAAMNAFTGCALRDTSTHLVFADGAADARMMFIGDAPAAEEDRSGVPFVGPSGQLLNKMLASIGLDRTKVRIANTVPWRPPGDRAATEAEIAVSLPFLRRHITLVQPECIILLGAVAAKAMLPPQPGNAGIGRLRGKWQSIELAGLAAPLHCLPTYHPAYLLRVPAAKRDSWHDFLALRQWMETGIITH